MKKGITIFLGVMVGALMFTSFLSAVNSEIIMAKNAALVVTSHPVIARDMTLSELEPEKYDSMIDSFHADKDSAILESDQKNDSTDSGGLASQQAMPVTSETAETEPDTPVALINDADAEKKSELLPLTASTATTPPEAAIDPPDATSAVTQDTDTTIIAEAAPEQNVPDQLHADAAAKHDTTVITESPVATDDHTVYTIQAGSFSDRLNAEKKYDSLVQTMAAADLHSLRIEKVGHYYTVRLGRFDHYVTAMKFLNAMHEKLSSAIVLDAYIKNERIVQLYNHAMLAGK